MSSQDYLGWLLSYLESNGIVDSGRDFDIQANFLEQGSIDSLSFVLLFTLQTASKANA